MVFSCTGIGCSKPSSSIARLISSLTPSSSNVFNVCWFIGCGLWVVGCWLWVVCIIEVPYFNQKLLFQTPRDIIRMIETGDDQWREYVPASAVRMVEHIKGEGK